MKRINFYNDKKSRAEIAAQAQPKRGELELIIIEDTKETSNETQECKTDEKIAINRKTKKANKRKATRNEKGTAF